MNVTAFSPANNTVWIEKAIAMTKKEIVAAARRDMWIPLLDISHWTSPGDIAAPSAVIIPPPPLRVPHLHGFRLFPSGYGHSPEHEGGPSASLVTLATGHRPSIAAALGGHGRGTLCHVSVPEPP